MELFPERLRRLRKDKGWTQEYLARKLNSVTHRISYYETGKFAPNVYMLECLADVFGVSMDYLWRGHD